MKRFWLISLVMLVPVLFLAAAAKSDNPKPQYSEDGHLLAPGDFREWIFLSSGLGMNYNPQAGGHEMFTNVFVPQWAYHEFLKSGKWPDKTMFVVEERGSESKGSINKVGHFQVEAMDTAWKSKTAVVPIPGRITTLKWTANRRRQIQKVAAGNVMTRMPRSNTVSCSFIPH